MRAIKRLVNRFKFYIYILKTGNRILEFLMMLGKVPLNVNDSFCTSSFFILQYHLLYVIVNF